MSSTSDSIVHSFYLAYYGRPADPAGLQFWSQQVDAANGDFTRIVDAFSSSAEATARFGSDSAADRIATIYQQLFDRAPDAGGLAYWQGAIENGELTLADAAVQILQGAQGSDGTLAALRLQAGERFTAIVAADGVHYDGLAAIQAAQVLIKAVGAHATDADIATLVSETAKLVATAAANPAVIAALATGTTLTALFDTVRGDADPVGLLRTLADVGTVAAGNPDTLESLLRGGGMQKVLAVMPAQATLTDIVDALAKGGMPAAVEVVYPSAPPVSAPPPAPASVSFTFHGVTEGPLDSVHDNVTNQAVADVTFSYTGARLSVIRSFEYSTDGGQTWHGDGITSDANAKTVTIAGLELGHRYINALPIHVNTPAPSDTTTTIDIRALDSAGHVISPAGQQDIVFDARVASPDVQLVDDSAGADIGTTYDGITRNADFTVHAEAGARVEYAAVNPSATSEVLHWSADKPVLHEGENTFYARATDAAGNTASTYADVTLDTTAPDAPTVKLHADTGSSNSDNVTSAATVDVTLPASAGDLTAWEYQVDAGQWVAGGARPADGVGRIGLDGLADGAHVVEVRQYDAAGNASQPVELAFTLDRTAPATQLLLLGVEGSVGGQPTAVAKPDVTFGYDVLEAGTHVEWSTDRTHWQADGIGIDSQNKTATITDVDLSVADETVWVHVIDDAGNTGATQGVAIDSTANNPRPEVSTVTGVTVDVSGNPGLVYLATGPETIKWNSAEGAHGFANAATLVVQDLSTGTATATVDNFTDGTEFSALAGSVRLDATPPIDLYKVSWSDDTFLTTGPSGMGYVSAGSAMFVGGVAGRVREAGFGIDELVTVHGDVTRPDDENRNTAFIDDGHSTSTIVAGGGMDLISDNGGTLNIVHDVFGPATHDVILGFDTGNDTITLRGAAAGRIDANGNGTIQWSAASSITAATEAVAFNNTGSLYTGGGTFAALNLGSTVGALNTQLNVSAVAQGHDLLLLANSGAQGALLVYTNLDGNGKIDAVELSFVDVYTGGAIQAGDIKLVGTQPLTPP